MKLHYESSLLDLTKQCAALNQASFVTIDAEHVLTGFHDSTLTSDGASFVTDQIESGIKLAVISDNDSKRYKHELIDQLPPEVPVYTALDYSSDKFYKMYKFFSAELFERASLYFDETSAGAVHIDDQFLALNGARKAGFKAGVLLKPNTLQANSQIKAFRVLDTAAASVISRYQIKS